MKLVAFLLLGGLAAALTAGCSRAGAAGEAVFRAAPCRVAPRIDGVRGEREWSEATRVPFDLSLLDRHRQARPSRACELWLMSSAENLYVAARIPDAEQNMSTSPFSADGAVLAFCRGKDVAAGDDRRALLPGAYADKHWVSPGKDADDARKDGAGAMVWKAGPRGGEYFLEYKIPLNSGDPQDIAARPGDRLRFNLLYIDKFTANFEGTELGGLFGVDTDHAAAWGTLELPAGVGAEAPPPPPRWLADLFPHTGAPDRLAHRLRRVDAEELAVAGQQAGIVTVELKYPGLDGRDELGQARIFLPPKLKKEPGKRVPLIHVAGYELNTAGAAGLLAQGFALSTPHAHPLNPLGRGVHLDQAILHAVRALPCIDPLRVSIQGGSAGGWMTLMLAADAFPLVWAMPNVPPIHLGYNLGYIAENQGLAAPAPGEQEARMPVLRAVGPIADQAKTLYGVPFDSPAYLAVSPLARWETLTAPMLTVFSTADMLVPLDQVAPKLLRLYDPARFPAGFRIAMTPRFPGVDGKRTLVEVLPESRYELFVRAAGQKPVRAGSPEPGEALSLPFSRTRPWSIVVLDEGAPEPAVGHFKYQWRLDHEPFRKWAEARGVTGDQLTPAKLRCLMLRLRGKSWRSLKVRPGSRGDLVEGNLLDYPEAERQDVLLGLTAFAADDARALRLRGLYQELPRDLKALGPRLGSGTAESVREALAGAGK